MMLKTESTSKDSNALEVSTAKTVLLYTASFLSEPADTMKDWVVTGICLLYATWIDQMCFLLPRSTHQFPQ